MENQQYNQLSKNQDQADISNSPSTSERIEEIQDLNSEVVECVDSQNMDDSGYSSDVDVFESPLDSMANQETRVSLSEYKESVDSYLKDLFTTSNLEEFIFCIEQLDCPSFAYEVVKRSIVMSCGRDDKERELVSRLLSYGYGKIFTTFCITDGFQKLIIRLPDLLLDCPDMEEFLSKFLARAIADEVLPPSFLHDPILIQNSMSVKHKTEAILDLPHSLEMIEHIWGPRAGVLSELSTTRSFILDTIREYFDCHDINECIRCMEQLKVPFYMHEFVKKTIEIAMDDDEKWLPLAKPLLIEACKREVVSHHQLVLGMKRLYSSLPDLVLDVPHAERFVNEMKDFFISKGLLNENELC